MYGNSGLNTLSSLNPFNNTTSDQTQNHDTTDTNKLQNGSNKVENESIDDTLEKMERDRKNAFISGVQNSATTMISSMAQNKISF